MASNLIPGSYFQARSPMVRSGPPWMQAAQQTLMPAPQEQLEAKVTIMDLVLTKAISGSTGLALGVMQAELKDGLDPHGVPIDLGYSVLADVIGYAANSPAMVASGSVAFGVYSFRKTVQALGALENLMGIKSKVAGETINEPEPAPAPTPETDPIVVAGETLDE